MRLSHALIGSLGLMLAACGPMQPGGGSRADGTTAPTGASGMSTRGSSTSSVVPIQGQDDVGPAVGGRP